MAGCEGGGMVEPTGTGSKEELSGFQARGPGFGPVGDLPHVNKDRASVARCCPA